MVKWTFVIILKNDLVLFKYECLHLLQKFTNLIAKSICELNLTLNVSPLSFGLRYQKMVKHT